MLIDWDPRHLYRKLMGDSAEMERFLAEVTTRDWHTPQDHGGDPAEATRRLQALHPGREELIAAFYGRFDEMCAHAIAPMADLVERLHAAGVSLYLLSNAPNFLDPWLRGPARARHPFLGRFRDYVVSGFVGCSKPDAAIYKLVCKVGGFAPEHAVFIDDLAVNIEGARAIGMAGVRHVSPEQTVADLRALGLPA